MTEGIQSAQDLWKLAEEEAGVALGEVPIMIKYLWFPTPQSGGKNPTVFEVGVDERTNQPKEIPLKPGFIVFGMFEDADEVRVYALATSPTDTAGKPNPPHRITLSKHAPVCGVAIMALNVFISSIADELLMLSGDLDDDDDEDDEEEDDLEDASGEIEDPDDPETDLPLDESEPPGPNGEAEPPPPEL